MTEQTNFLSSKTLDHAIRRIKATPLRAHVGRINEVRSNLVRANLTGGSTGDLCALSRTGRAPLRAEIIGVQGNDVFLSPFGDLAGLSEGGEVRPIPGALTIPVGDSLLGRTIDVFGSPIDGLGPLLDLVGLRPIRAEAPAPLDRPLIDTPLPLGIKVIDATMTIGRGQRMAIFGPPGTGKSTLLSAIAHRAEADVVVIGLVGERGREVREFTERALPPEDRARLICVSATSDRPANERAIAASSATAVAEYFRDEGRSVLLIIDSLTRTARALREIGLAAGEPPTRRGYPASVYPALPAIIERAGRTNAGDITALYSVLVEDDGQGDPIAEEIRSLTDGFISLSQELAESGHWPAIDPLTSLSRLMTEIVPFAHTAAADRAREHLAKFRDIELLVQVGQYSEGTDKAADAALAAKPKLDALFRQKLAIGEPKERLDHISNQLRRALQ